MVSVIRDLFLYWVIICSVALSIAILLRELLIRHLHEQLVTTLQQQVNVATADALRQHLRTWSTERLIWMCATSAVFGGMCVLMVLAMIAWATS